MYKKYMAECVGTFTLSFVVIASLAAGALLSILVAELNW